MLEKQQTDQWVLSVSSDHRWLDLHILEVWKYRDLILLFVKRNFAAEFKQTILGPFWHLFRALASSAVFTLVFSGMGGLSTDELPPFLFYLTGNLAWSFFSDCFLGNSNIFVANAALFGKVYFPRLVMPMTTIFTAFLNYLIRFGLFITIFIGYSLAGAPVQFSWWIALMPVLLLITALMGMGLGFMSSALTARYRDLQILISYGMSLLLYSSPVIYPASMVPDKYLNIYFINPVAPVVEAFRFVLLGTGTVDISRLVYSLVFSIVVSVLGIVIFNRVERNFMDTI